MTTSSPTIIDGLRNLLLAVALLLAAPAVAAPPERPAPGEVIDQVARYTGLTNDAVSLALKDNAAALGRLTDAVQALQIAQRFLDARNAEIAADVFWAAADTAAEKLLPPPLMTAIKAARIYKTVLEELRDNVLIPALDQKFYEQYRAERRQNQDPINAFDFAVTTVHGYDVAKPKMVEELIKAKGWNVDLMGERLRRLAETQVDRFWRERMEATYQQETVKPQKEAILAAVWASVQDVLDQLKAPPAALNAGLFPDPGRDLPSGWWWARSAGATYKPPEPMQSHTPMWKQTVELSNVQGYVFKTYRDGGSWCRPAPNGKCDLPYQRIEIDISDWTMHGGESACVRSLQGQIEQFRDIYRRLSERAASYVRHDPEQNGMRFCLKNFSVSLNNTALNGAAPDPAITRHFADVIVRRINAQTGGKATVDSD